MLRARAADVFALIISRRYAFAASVIRCRAGCCRFAITFDAAFLPAQYARPRFDAY